MPPSIERGDGIQCPKCHSRHLPLNSLVENGKNVYAATCQHCGHFFKFSATPTPKSSVTFTINGKAYTVGNTYPGSMSLNAYIREVARLPGTKVMCAEGGCGCCVVTVTHDGKSYAMNSCLCPIYSCDGWDIQTTEGIGGKRQGFHPIQEKLADLNGSQCGYCSPGMVMNMYGFLSGNSKPTQQQIEDAFDGNICRCTGFRPILDAMKSFAIDNLQCSGSVADIEDINKRICSKTGNPCSGTCNPQTSTPEAIHLVLAEAQWFTPTTLSDLYALADQYQDKHVKFVSGNSGKGVYNDGPYDVWIDTKKVPDFGHFSATAPDVFFGANVTLTQMMDTLNQLANSQGFEYCAALANHISRVANTPVRNVATWAGNLMMKHAHNEFPSDIFLILETVQARLTIRDSHGISECSPLSFLSFCTPDNMILQSVKLPQMLTPATVRTYKIMPRATNAHAYVNAGFNFKLDASQNYKVTDTPSIVYGGISSTFVHATKTEAYLNGKELGDASVLKGAIQMLMSEVIPDADPVLSSVAYRKNLAIGLFYKYVLSACTSKASASYKTGGDIIQRPLSSGRQSYDTDQTEYPVSQAIPKLSGKIQASGEASYTADLNSDLHAEFVITSVATGKLGTVDASAALKMPGVHAFYQAKDIPGVNNFMFGGTEEVFCSGDVKYAGQAIGIIVADNIGQAKAAADAVSVTYTGQTTPILTMKDALSKQSMYPDQHQELKFGDAESAIKTAPKSIEGEITMETQYHMHMETQCCVAEPTEDQGLHVYASTQYCTGTQQGISQVLNMPINSIRVEVKRLGGGYGGKITRNFMVSTACALAAMKLNRRVKIHLGLHTNMKMVGGRVPWLAKYKVGYTDEGLLKGVKIQYYCDLGCTSNGGGTPFVWSDNAYYCQNWHFLYDCLKTNTAAKTACRAPGSTPAIFIMESLMDHVATALGKDPAEVRKVNLYQDGQLTPTSTVKLQGCHIRDVVSQIEASSQIVQRKKDIETFNQANRWKKRGLSLIPLKFTVGLAGMTQGVQITVYGNDGTITISHGGIEMGQGINTKAVQTVAYELKTLGVTMDIINVGPTDTQGAGANGQVSGGSVTSGAVCLGFVNACALLKQRLAPVRASLPNPTWKQLIAKAQQEGINLTLQYWENPQKPTYYSYGATVSEAELDILTGEYIIKRMDLLYDCGQSMNPSVDIGQIEGAVTMGLGYWLLEKMRYNPQSGENLTSGTWEYKPPFAKDIPVDLRIDLLKNAAFPAGVLSSKAVAEPPLCMSCSVLFAIKRCIEAARRDQNMSPSDYFALDAPATVEMVLTQCLPQPTDYTYGQ
ncbi:unnamed protein product [Owenia fusiformis]|uniref:FAD-binding PCMH-type domain-containing protein n=1 Tax=Owenia fusiformis TaxID=6347 RepID=A0A8S4P1L8_OWEFU|nr:unnamed protein product [Owenia fusiformis]